ncbi:ATP-binding protein [Candidatus Riflebacteria bacterium]
MAKPIWDWASLWTRYLRMENFFELAVFQTDSTGNYIFVNRPWSVISGISCRKAEGGGWVDGIHPDDRSEVLAEWQHAVEKKIVFTKEYRLRTTDGKIRWILCKAAPEFDNRGKITGFLGTIRNISPEKNVVQKFERYRENITKLISRQTEKQEIISKQLHLEIKEHRLDIEKFHKEKEFLKNVMESVSDKVYVIDVKDFSIKTLNSFLNNEGSKGGELPANITCHSLLNGTRQPCEGPGLICPVKKIKETKRPCVVEHQHFNEAGEPIFVEIFAYPFFDREGKVTHIVEFSRNLGDYRRAQSSLRRAYERLERNVVESDEELRFSNEMLKREIEEREQIEKELLFSKKQLDMKNRIANLFLTVSGDDIYSEVLNVVLQVMESRYGIFGYINEAGDMVCPTLTSDIWEECRMPEKDFIFLRDAWKGIWGQALMEKRSLYSNKPFVVPAGHIPVKRALVVPIIYRKELIGYIQIANKEKDYTEKDLLILESITNQIAPILYGRLQKERHEEKRSQAEVKSKKLLYALEKRVMELNCLYGLSKIMENPRFSIEEIFQQTIKVIPAAWQYSEVTTARISFTGKEFKGKNFRKSQWRQRSYIIVHGKKEGFLEIVYTQKREPAWEGPFLKEERQLINAIAYRLGRVIGRRRAEDALKESEEKYRTMMEALKEPVYIVTPDYEIAFMNSAMQKSVGKQSIEGPCYRVIHDLKERCPWCDMDEIIAGRSVEMEVKSPVASQVFNISSTPIAHENGSVAKLSILRDITKKKFLEDQLIRSERFAAAGLLASSVAHEINSPLQGIVSLIGSIKSENTVNIELLQDMELIEGGINRIKETVRKLLDLNRPGKEKKQCLCINRIIEDTASLMLSHLKRNKISINLQLSKKVPMLMASPQQLSQVFVNLINNSIEAMVADNIEEKGIGENGFLNAEILIKSYLRKGHIMIEFSDTGPGIPPEILGKVFDPFYSQKKLKGMGIGLSICSKIIENHMGEIVVRNPPRNGAHFKITLPVCS